MNRQMKINEQVTVGAQPTSDELRKLKQAGFQTIVNFRSDGEDDQPLSTLDEGRMVHELGLDYLHIPVSPEQLNSDSVDQFRKQFGSLPKPIFAHCKSGKRAGAMVMMHIAVEQGWSGDETLRKADEMGFECEQPELIQFVKEYVDNHAAATD